MNDRGWLETLLLVLLALFVYDRWIRRGRAGAGAGVGPAGGRWENLRTPNRDVVVSTGLAPNASGGVPAVDAIGKCGCS